MPLALYTWDLQGHSCPNYKGYQPLLGGPTRPLISSPGVSGGLQGHLTPLCSGSCLSTFSSSELPEKSLPTHRLTVQVILTVLSLFQTSQIGSLLCICSSQILMDNMLFQKQLELTSVSQEISY